MNEKLNLVEVLKDAPKGTKLWSPIIGDCELFQIIEDELYPIVCKHLTDHVYYGFTSSGRLTHCDGAECVLFPSLENRDWSTFKTTKKHKEFEPFQKVLVKFYVTSGEYIWCCSLYSHYDESMDRHYLANFGFTTNDDNIIPYEGNEDKLGKAVE